MKRSLLIVLIVLLSLVIASDAHAAPTASRSAFARFQHRVCRGEKTMGRKAAPAVLRFNQLFYNEEEHSSENLKAAGRELRQAYLIYRDFNKRILATKAPAGSARLWRRYGRQQHQVQRLGFRAAGALEAADLSTFNRLKARNENWQAKRNTTWARIGIVCA
jgi:hypothetical protein